MQRAARSKMASGLGNVAQKGSNKRIASGQRTTSLTGHCAAKTSAIKPAQAVSQRLAVEAARAAAAAQQRRSAAARTSTTTTTTTAAAGAAGAAMPPRRGNTGVARQTALIYGRRYAQVQPPKVAAAAAAVPKANTEGKPKVSRIKNRSYAVYDKQQAGKRQQQARKKPTDMDLELIIGPVQVLTQPRRVYNTQKRFFVPLQDQVSPRDFQRLHTAGQRYKHKLQCSRIEEARQKAEMTALVAATRPLLPQWLPLDELLPPPPPPQFADDNADDNVWKYRMHRNDTVTLCNFPTWESKLLVREYAGRLPVKSPSP
ncbi:uncharacterized protein Dvir_GJ26846 [Drosophila virilis]|uniref:Uncharacterized protein n=1 Tax=Drosophila virilis TaxID=7244 RepID=A0A0Q9W793_DROVI|nr:uncharacterized protein Dvir_GJ26846 [Drosophila virilis]